MTGAEGIATIPQAVENLSLKAPMVIPKEIKDLELAGQLPAGNIGYFDILDPELRPVDRNTWGPIMKAKKEKRFNPERVPRKFAAIILHTPARTPENSYDETIEQLSQLLKRTSKKDEHKVTIEQNLGTLFIVEDRGEDTQIGWRQDALAIKGKKGLVIDTSHEGTVTITDSYILSYARRKRQHPTIDLRVGRAGPIVDSFPDEIEENAERQGFTADTTALRQEARATRNPPRTIGNLRHGGNTTYTSMDSDGHPIVVDISMNGTQTVSNPEGLRELQQQIQTKKTPEIVHQPGDIVPSDEKCYACTDGHAVRQYYVEKEKRGWELKSDIICNGTHPGGKPLHLKQGLDEGPYSFPKSRTKTFRPPHIAPK